MEYKTEFGASRVFKALKPGEFFRCEEANVFLKTNQGYVIVSCGDHVQNPSWNGNVVRIRIDRVEDGIPVFVDA